MSFIVLDTETTGLSPTRDRLVEIAACRCDAQSGEIEEEFHRYLNPGIPVPDEAVAIHGLTDEFLSDKPRFGEIAPELSRFLDGSPIVIHNAPFDTRFLTEAYRASGQGEFGVLPTEVICTRSLARRLIAPKQSASLDALCDLFGIDRSSRTNAAGRSVHGALIDCRLLAKVYLHLLALDSERNARIGALMPFADGVLPESTEELCRGYLALEAVIRPLERELKRIQEKVKTDLAGRPFQSRDAMVSYTPQLRTNWEAVREKYLAGVDLSPYQTSSPRIRIEAA